MSKLAEHLRQLPSRRNPPYRPTATIDDAERARLDAKLGSADNYDILQLREMVRTDPDNIEFRKALVSGIISAEFAGIDSFSRKVCEWQDWDVPWDLIMAMARQTWDEVRHAWLAKGIIESYGGEVGEYPDTLAGGAPPSLQQGAQQAAAAQQDATSAGNGQQTAGGQGGAGRGGMFNEPVASLSMVNVSLEGGALTLFKGTSELGRRIGDKLMERCFDYNWADEVTHVAIGDYFVKELCENDPEAEKRALRAHAMFEYGRARLNEDQTQELKEFFAEEMQRAQAALAGEQAAD